MVLTDAGPLIALLDRGEPDHLKCEETSVRLHGPMLTTWPVFTEAIYLLRQAGGWMAQEPLWRLFRRGDLMVEMPRESERIAALMSKYQSVPMDLADASLVALAEERGLTTIFTLDRDFRIYRLSRGRAFTVIP